MLNEPAGAVLTFIRDLAIAGDDEAHSIADAFTTDE